MIKTPSVCDQEVYSRIYKDKAQEIRNFLYYKCGDLDEAEDIAQEAFVRLWNKCKEIIYEKVGGFLYTVSNNLFLDKVRSKKVSLKFEKEQPPAINTEDPFHLLRTEEFRLQIENEISRLPDGQREAFLLNRIDKLTYKEIAYRLGISQTAVEKRISKALAKLKNTIEEFSQNQI